MKYNNIMNLFENTSTEVGFEQSMESIKKYVKSNYSRIIDKIFTDERQKGIKYPFFNDVFGKNSPDLDDFDEIFKQVPIKANLTIAITLKDFYEFFRCRTFSSVNKKSKVKVFIVSDKTGLELDCNEIDNYNIELLNPEIFSSVVATSTPAMTILNNFENSGVAIQTRIQNMDEKCNNKLQYIDTQSDRVILTDFVKICNAYKLSFKNPIYLYENYFDYWGDGIIELLQNIKEVNKIKEKNNFIITHILYNKPTYEKFFNFFPRYQSGPAFQELSKPFIKIVEAVAELKLPEQNLEQLFVIEEPSKDELKPFVSVLTELFDSYLKQEIDKNTIYKRLQIVNNRISNLS